MADDFGFCDLPQTNVVVAIVSSASVVGVLDFVMTHLGFRVENRQSISGPDIGVDGSDSLLTPRSCSPPGKFLNVCGRGRERNVWTGAAPFAVVQVLAQRSLSRFRIWKFHICGPCKHAIVFIRLRLAS